MDFDEFLKQIEMLNKKNTEAQAWELWLTYPPQVKEEHPFGEFLDGILDTSDSESGVYADQVFF